MYKSNNNYYNLNSIFLIKGLWLYKEILQSENEESSEPSGFIVMDTEGLGATEESANYDSKIFLFALLLSSYFVFNSMGTIDENSLNDLNLIINMARVPNKAYHNNSILIKEIHARTTSPKGKGKKMQFDTEPEIPTYSPLFLWVVRDFSLKLVDPTGKPLKPKEYLEQAL